jgi:hypothetical protein
VSAARTEPVRLTRANLIGVTYRLSRTYGFRMMSGTGKWSHGISVLGVRIYLAYHASKGCNDALMVRALANAITANRSGFANVSGNACSDAHYARLTLTSRERERRECEGRKARALEQYEATERRRVAS